MNFEYIGNYVDAHEYPPEQDSSLFSGNLRSSSNSRIDKPFFSVQADLSNSNSKNHSSNPNNSFEGYSRSRPSHIAPRGPTKKPPQSAQKENRPSVQRSASKEERPSARENSHSKQHAYETDRQSSRRYSSNNLQNVSQNNTPGTPSKNSNYVSLSERLANMKASLDEKNKEVLELKDANNKLKSELNDQKRHSIEKASETKLKMKNIKDDVGVHPQQILEQYRNLYKAYEELVKTNIQTEESLRMETIRAEEQRAYIEVLKQNIENHIYSNQLLPYLKKTISRDNTLFVNKAHDNTNDNITDLYVDIVGMHAQIQKLKSKESDFKIEIDRIATELKASNAEREKLLNENTQYFEVNEKLNSELQQVINALHVAQNEYSKVNDEKERLLEYFDSSKGSLVKKTDLEKLSKRNAENLDRLKELERDYESLKLLSDEIDKQRKLAVETLGEREKNIEQLKKEKENILSTLREKEMTASERSQELRNLAQRLDEQTRDYKELENKLESVNDNYATINSTLNETQQELEKAHETIHQLKEHLKSQEESLSSRQNLLDRENNLFQMKIKDLEKELLSLQTKLEDSELLRTNLIREKLAVEKEKQECLDEIEQLKNDNHILVDELDHMKEEMDSRFKTSTSSSQELHDLSKKCEEKDRTIKKLKDNLSLAEREIALLKKNDSARTKERLNSDFTREEIQNLQEKVDGLNGKLLKLRDNEKALVNELERFRRIDNQIDDQFSTIIRELNSVLDMSLTDEERRLAETAYSETNTSKDLGDKRFNETMRLIEFLKRELDTVNTKYTQAKLDLLKEMEKNRETDRKSHDEEKKSHRNDEEKAALQRKITQLELQNRLLVEENERIQSEKSKSNTYRNRENKHENDLSAHELKVKDYVIIKLRNFIFNGDVIEILEELTQVQEDLLKTERDKYRGHQYDPHGTGSTHMTDRKLMSPADSQYGEDPMDLLRVRKNTLENELYKLEIQEKRKYDSVYMLEKQNYQLKSEVSRLMNEIDHNSSKYHDDHTQYYSNKGSERPSVGNDNYNSNPKSDIHHPFPLDSKRSFEKRSYRKEFEEKYSSSRLSTKREETN